VSADFGDGTAADFPDDHQDVVLDRFDVLVWAEQGFADPRLATDWARAGFGPEQAACWVQQGLDEVDEAAGYAALGLDPGEAQQWSFAWVGPRQCALWLRMGMDVRDADAWLELGVEAEQAEPWIRRGLSAADANAWVEIAGSGVAASLWIEAGYAVEEAAGLLRLPEDDPRRPDEPSLRAMADRRQRPDGAEALDRQCTSPTAGSGRVRVRDTRRTTRTGAEMTTPPPALPAAAMRRCPSDDHGHDEPLIHLDVLHEAQGLPPGTSARGQQETDDMLRELERRRCAGGPLVTVTDTGELDRLASDEFIGFALAGLPEHDPDDGPAPSLHEVLAGMGIRTVDDLRSFRRLVAVHAALRALHWAAVPPADVPSAADALLVEIDDPARGWAG
jgi:hypothetical protein